MTVVAVALRLVALAGLLLFSAVSWTWDSELALPSAWTWLGTFAVAAGTLWLAPRPWWQRAVARIRDATRPDRWFWPYGLAALVFLATAASSWAVFDGLPHVQDEFAYIFQARVMAAGRMSATPPPFPEFFYCPWVVVQDGRWFAIFPPGWPLILSLGVRLGVPLLVNPLLAGLCIIAAHRVAVRLFDRRTAVFAALLCALSPFLLFLSSSAMSHTTVLLLSLWTAGGVLAATDRPLSVAALGALALAAGLAVLTRPLDGLLLWGAAAAMPMVVPRPGARRPWDAVLASGAGLAVGLAAYLLFARYATGQWLTEPMALVQPQNRFGFGPDIGLNWETFATPGHTPWRAVLNLNFNLSVLNQDLFGWPVPSLLPVLALLLFGRLGWAHLYCLAPLVALAAGYAFYWYHGVAYGARFYLAAVPCLAMLTVEALRRGQGAIARRWPAGLGRGAPPWIPTATVLAFAFTALVYVPRVALVAPYPAYRGINRGVLEFVEAAGLRHALVFVRAPRAFHFAPAFAANEIPLRRGSVVYALDLGPERNAQLAELFPGRVVAHYEHHPLPSRAQRWVTRMCAPLGVSFPPE